MKPLECTGTGKTTVARAIANVLFNLNLLPTNNIVETSALGLTADYVGQTKSKVGEVLQEARGGVLFIDEAYNLGVGHFGKEAVDTIVEAMTSETYKNVVIVIAGYPDEIHAMFRSNSGLKSRFTHFFEFPDWGPKDCVTFFHLLSKKRGFTLAQGIDGILKEACSTLIGYEGWGNGRDVTKLWEDAKSARDVRVYSDVAANKELSVHDVKEAITAMLIQRKPRPFTVKPNQRQREFAFASADLPFPAVGSVIEGEDLVPSNETEQGEDEDSEHTCELGHDKRDDGVPDDVWQALQERKKEERKRAIEVEKLQEYLKKLQAEIAEAELQKEEKERLEQLMAQAQEKELRQLEAEIERLREAERLAQLKRIEEENKRRELERKQEELRKKEEIKKKLRQISKCPAGFEWYKVNSGWRCGGGSHFASEEELHRRFGL